MIILSKKFYERNTLTVARELLGCILKHRLNNKVLSGIIVETEAYTQEDPACHAYRGRTSRSETLFKHPGLAYVYFIYGMYHCMNIVTEEYGRAGAVLIRALEPLETLKNTNGPGKLCREMQITRSLNEVDTTSTNSELWVEEGIRVSDEDVIKCPRIGIKEATDLHWRFYIRNNKFVSKPLRK